MKYLLSGIATYLLLASISVAYADTEPLSCKQLAVNYGNEAVTFTDLRKHVVMRVAKGDEKAVKEAVKQSIDKLTSYLRAHNAQHCDNEEFIRTYAETIFPKPDDYLSRFWEDGSLDGRAYCSSIEDAKSQLNNVIKTLESMKQDRDRLMDMWDVASAEGYGIHHRYFSYLALYTGVKHKGSKVLPDVDSTSDIKALTSKQLQEGERKTQEVIHIYEDILGFQGVREVALCGDVLEPLHK